MGTDGGQPGGSDGNSWRVLEFFAFFVSYFGVCLAIVNARFPIKKYFEVFGYPRERIVFSYLILAFIVTSLTVAIWMVIRRSNIRWPTIVLCTILQWLVVSIFAISCSGAGFGWSIRGDGLLSWLSLFFAEFEFLRFVFECGIPLAAAAAFFYFALGRLQARRKPAFVDSSH